MDKQNCKSNRKRIPDSPIRLVATRKTCTFGALK